MVCVTAARRSWLASVVLGLVVVLCAERASAQASPINLALFNPIQLVPETASIHGLRLNIYGKNRDMHGLDFGFIHEATGNLVGIEFGLVNWVHRDAVGIQVGLMSQVGGHLIGGQLNWLSLAGSIEGAQIGLLNHAERVDGLQFGLVNIADQLRGLQLGLVNIALNGFLPVFVLFNFAF